jgi:hypothetical protein
MLCSVAMHACMYQALGKKGNHVCGQQSGRLLEQIGCSTVAISREPYVIMGYP